MKTAFLTEMGFHGKVPNEHPNMRTEMAWMNALCSDHYNIHEYEQVKGFDAVFVIFPKAVVKLNMEGLEMSLNKPDKDMTIYTKPIVEVLKNNNTKVCFVQEGPAWFFNDYDLMTQFNFFNDVAECDIVFAHNVYDTAFYKGLFPNTQVEVIPTLMGPYKVPDFQVEHKAIIGGNFCRWYGGFQSYVVASEFNCPIFCPSMHCKRPGEESVPNLQHLPYMMWTDWINHLKRYKYAVHLMPTVAAGTFAMNCAVMGVPCIGNDKVDTQLVFFPELSVDVNDIQSAHNLAIALRDDTDFYNGVVEYTKLRVADSFYTNTKKWISHIESIVYE